MHASGGRIKEGGREAVTEKECANAWVSQGVTKRECANAWVSQGVSSHGPHPCVSTPSDADRTPKAAREGLAALDHDEVAFHCDSLGGEPGL